MTLIDIVNQAILDDVVAEILADDATVSDGITFNCFVLQSLTFKKHAFTDADLIVASSQTAGVVISLVVVIHANNISVMKTNKQNPLHIFIYELRV